MAKRMRTAEETDMRPPVASGLSEERPANRKILYPLSRRVAIVNRITSPIPFIPSRGWHVLIFRGSHPKRGVAMRAAFGLAVLFASAVLADDNPPQLKVSTQRGFPAVEKVSV